MNEVVSMPIYIAILFVLGGIILLVGGGETLVKGASSLAKRLGMSPLLIGLTVVAFGTSVPELFISLTASFQGLPDIMIGNVIGSNIANVGLIMGICGILAPLKVTIKDVWIELLLVICGSVIVMLCSGYGFFPRPVGFLFITTLIAYTSLRAMNGRKTKERKKANTTDRQGKLYIFIILIVAGLIMLSTGSNIFIKGAAEIARHLGISELIIGLTLAAVGTSLPELASSIAALRQKQSGMLIGNVVGSNMFNLFMVLGLTGAIKPFAMSRELLLRDLPVMLAFTIILLPILKGDGSTKRWHGLLLLSAYIIYCVLLFQPKI